MVEDSNTTIMNCAVRGCGRPIVLTSFTPNIPPAVPHDDGRTDVALSFLCSAGHQFLARYGAIGDLGTAHVTTRMFDEPIRAEFQRFLEDPDLDGE